MRRVLVTGATGGIGLALVPALLAEGVVVIASGRRFDAGVRLTTMGADFRPAQLVSDPLEPLLDGVDTVFHLAARSSPWGRADDFEADNVEATKRLLAASSLARVRRFVFASSPSIYTERRDRLGLTEESPVAAVFSGHYARTKYLAERLVLRRDSARMRTIAIRPRAVAGPDDSVLLPRLARVAARGPLPMPRGGEALVEITDVRDVTAALIAAAREQGLGGVAVNVSGGVPLQFRSLAFAVCEAAGLPFRMREISEPMLHLGARFSEAGAWLARREPALTRHAALSISWSQTFDLSGAARLLGWRPRYRPEEAIDFALKWQQPR